MTTAEQMQAMTTRIVAEALDIVRAEAEQREEADRMRWETEWARERLREMDESPEMPGPGYDAQMRPLR